MRGRVIWAGFKSEFGATPSCYVPEDAALRKERLTLQDHATLSCLTKRYAGKKVSPDQFPEPASRSRRSARPPVHSRSWGATSVEACLE